MYLYISIWFFPNLVYFSWRNFVYYLILLIFLWLYFFLLRFVSIYFTLFYYMLFNFILFYLFFLFYLYLIDFFSFFLEELYGKECKNLFFSNLNKVLSLVQIIFPWLRVWKRWRGTLKLWYHLIFILFFIFFLHFLLFLFYFFRSW